MKYGIDPSNLHEFSLDVIDYYGEGNFEVIDELERVQATLSSFSKHASDTRHMGANTIDDLLIDFLKDTYKHIKASIDEQEKAVKPKKSEVT